jgi:hypothetical protein
MKLQEHHKRRVNESHVRSAVPLSPLAASFADALEGILREESGARVAAIERAT